MTTIVWRCSLQVDDSNAKTKGAVLVGFLASTVQSRQGRQGRRLGGGNSKQIDQTECNSKHANL